MGSLVAGSGADCGCVPPSRVFEVAMPKHCEGRKIGLTRPFHLLCNAIMI